ncbi:DUF4350 domain-containing protein [Kitasatospora sp. NPDC096147]|uniref:DUF4350 domain-containing protein n=1 Tax=Kitasatospora sp. NPDC096147 TaxID=3364093 RepID=UPI0037FA3C64
MSTDTTAPAPAGPPDAPSPGASADTIADATADTSVRVFPGWGRIWRRGRWYLLGTAVLLVGALLVTGLDNHREYPALDPRDPDPHGSRAVIRLLEQRGVEVRTVATQDGLSDALAEPATTVVLPYTVPLTAGQLGPLSARKRGGDSRLVLISPDEDALAGFAPGVSLATTPDGTPRTGSSTATDPDCKLPEATRAGSAELGGLLYRPGSGDTGCYPVNGRPALVRHTEPGSRETVVLGSGRFLSNERLTEQGNASLALGLLGSRHQLVWYLPDYSAASRGEQPKSLTDHIPAGWDWAALQLAVAALLAALWRARRLGPVVTEELPVVVRATETTEGRARLYQRAKARGRAADALRRATRHRIAPVLGVPLHTGEPDPAVLCPALADRLGRPATDLHALLYGDAPTDDAALLRLTDALDALERQVRQP